MIVDAFADEMNLYVDMLHFRMGVGVMCAYDGPLVVTTHEGGSRLIKTEFFKEGAEPDDLSGTVSAHNVFCLTGG
jgi:hypothetical protein